MFVNILPINQNETVNVVILKKKVECVNKFALNVSFLIRLFVCKIPAYNHAGKSRAESVYQVFML